MTQPIVLYAGFDKGTDPVTGLTVTVNVYRITRSSGASSQIVTAGSATALGDGVYLYAIGSADLQTYDYLAAFKTTGDVDKKTVWAVYPPLANAYATELANLDAAISSRNATTPLDSTATQAAAAAALAAYDPPTKTEMDTGLAGVPDALLDGEEASAGVTIRQAIAASGSASDPMLNTASGYPSGSLGGVIASINPAQVTVTSPVATDGTEISVVYGDDYLSADGRALTFTSASWPTLTGGSVVLIVYKDGTVVNHEGVVSGAQSCYVELTDEQTAALPPKTYIYDLQATLDNVTASVITLVQGKMLVTADVR